MRHPSALAFGALLVAVALGLPARARVNLPQSTQVVVFSQGASRDLQAQVRDGVEAGTPQWTAAEKTLLTSLPDGFGAACGEIITHWGTIAEGTARWTVQPLQVERTGLTPSLLLAFRCGSTYPGYAQYYDERLALLTFDASGGSLRFIPFAKDCDNCSDLYHVEFLHVLAVDLGTLWELRVASSTDNPCCDGPEQESKESLYYFLFPEGRLVFSLERAHETFSHNVVDGDWEERCQSQPGYERDPDGYLTAINLETRCRITGEPELVLRQRYAWDRAARGFVTGGSPQP